VLRWMRQGQRSRVRNLASFLSSSPALVSIFASCGLHFVSLQRQIAVVSFSHPCRHHLFVHSFLKLFSCLCSLAAKMNHTEDYSALRVVRAP
jgi:hypothetical protein